MACKRTRNKIAQNTVQSDNVVQLMKNCAYVRETYEALFHGKKVKGLFGLNKPKEEKQEQKRPDDWVSLVEERITQAEDWEEKRQMMAQVNYYRGNQWLVWNPTSKKMMMAPLENGEQRITVNQIRPRMMVKLAKQIKNRVKFDVVPDSNDETRIEIAKATSKFLKYWWEQTGMHRKTRDIFLNNGVKAGVPQKCILMRKLVKILRQGRGNRLRRRDGATIYRRNTMPYMRPTYVVCVSRS